VIFSYPAFDGSAGGVSPSEYCHKVWCGKTRAMVYQTVKKENMLISFDRNRQTPGEMDIGRAYA